MEKSKIEWTDSSYNPISGCLHGCPYCYARKTANRFKGCDLFPDGENGNEINVLEDRMTVTTKSGLQKMAMYPFGFKPTFHKYRLNDLKTKKFGKSIFVCSMADMFGDWVPDEWIEEIFAACLAAPEHNYLFLTKNPKRYYELASEGKLPMFENFWYGTSCTTTKDLFFWSRDFKCFLSIEPMLGRFKFEEGTPYNLQYIDGVIIGAETGNRKDKVVPKREWVEELVEGLKQLDIPVFMKDSLIPIWGEDIITQLPWEKDD